MKYAITSVYANPLHPGHIECFELSRALADQLIVIVNNDDQAMLKRGTESFQHERFRMRLVESLRAVDRVVLSTDTDASVCKTLEALISEIRMEDPRAEIMFTKGGDRFAHEIPERTVLDTYGVTIVDGLGKKTHSSSHYVRRIANEHDAATLAATLETLPLDVQEREYIEVGVRPWGVYYVMEDQPMYKVKKIIVTPGHRLSLQRHQHRSEHWVVVAGEASVEIREKNEPMDTGHRVLTENESCHVPQGHVHRLANKSDRPLVIVEVQTGSYTGEDDIERYEDDYARIG